MTDKRLSFTTKYNYQKILPSATSSGDITATALTDFTPYLTVPTGLVNKPTARVFMEFNNVLTEAIGDTAVAFNIFTKSIAVLPYFDASNQLVIQAANGDASNTTFKVYYRIYVDARSL